ncbi:hypothetical protein KNE206_77070 [Kitasatospora sp. NE20-6]|uniref:hypothetical protein n=1 Tax=Kitasatospora sp. NE20-6 TaxID=2859066 RepID=UPI0034DC4363
MDTAFTLAWQHAVGLVHPEDLPMAAARLLAENLDSPALRDLAGRSRNDGTTELDALLRKAMGELGVAVPDQEIAERCLLRHQAARLTAGEATSGEVAAALWHGMADTATDPEIRFLRAALEDEYYLDHMEAHRPEAFRAWENTLRAAATALDTADDSPLTPGSLPDRARRPGPIPNKMAGGGC